MSMTHFSKFTVLFPGLLAILLAPACGGDDGGDDTGNDDGGSADDDGGSADGGDDAPGDESGLPDDGGDDAPADDGGDDAPESECSSSDDCPLVVCECPDGPVNFQGCSVVNDVGVCATADTCMAPDFDACS
jgi:hypothetical protein